MEKVKVIKSVNVYRFSELDEDVQRSLFEDYIAMMFAITNDHGTSNTKKAEEEWEKEGKDRLFDSKMRCYYKFCKEEASQYFEHQRFFEDGTIYRESSND